MINKQRLIADNKKLLIVWDILQESRAKNNHPSKYGKDFFNPNFFLFTDYEIATETEIVFILQGLLREGLIEELAIKKQEHKDEDDQLHLLEERRFKTKDVPKDTKNKEYLGFGIITPYEIDIKKYIWDFHMKISKKKTESYIKEYLAHWKNDNLTLTNRNFLQAKRQLKEVVSSIHFLLKDYPPTNLLVAYKKYRYEEIDFVATILFLEQVNDIEIVELWFTGKEMAFRVNILSKFFDDFPDDGFLPFSDTDFENVLNQNKRVKTKSKEKIRPTAPRILEYKGIEYGINEGTTPYKLIEFAKKNNGIVNYKSFRLQTREPKERDKDLKEFRRRLRNRFGIDASKLLFEIKGGQIVFDMDMFDFS